MVEQRYNGAISVVPLFSGRTVKVPNSFQWHRFAHIFLLSVLLGMIPIAEFVIKKLFWFFGFFCLFLHRCNTHCQFLYLYNVRRADRFLRHQMIKRCYNAAKKNTFNNSICFLAKATIEESKYKMHSSYLWLLLFAAQFHSSCAHAKLWCLW